MLMRGTWYFFCLRHMRMCFSEHITAEELWKMNLWDYMEVVVVDGIPAIFIFRSSWAIEIGQCKKQEGFFVSLSNICAFFLHWPDVNSKAYFLAVIPKTRRPKYQNSRPILRFQCKRNGLSFPHAKRFQGLISFARHCVLYLTNVRCMLWLLRFLLIWARASFMSKNIQELKYVPISLGQAS